jgi:hypothetical protein
MTTLVDQDRDARLKSMIQTGWSPELFAEYWSAPDIAYIPSMITQDIVGYWPGLVVRGPEEYTRALADLLELLPDLRLEVPEYAVNGDIAFVRWIMHATGPNGPFQMTGVDRVRTRDGVVCENVIIFDSAEFHRHITPTP